MAHLHNADDCIRDVILRSFLLIAVNHMECFSWWDIIQNDPWWRHGMDFFYITVALWGNPHVTAVDSPHKGASNAALWSFLWKQSSGRGFETSWSTCDVTVMLVRYREISWYFKQIWGYPMCQYISRHSIYRHVAYVRWRTIVRSFHANSD